MKTTYLAVEVLDDKILLEKKGVLWTIPSGISITQKIDAEEIQKISQEIIYDKTLKLENAFHRIYLCKGLRVENSLFFKKLPNYASLEARIIFNLYKI